MVKEIDLGEVANKFRSELREQLAELSQTLTLVGFLVDGRGAVTR